ncbi:hypothetical protein GEMRC1_013464 [Eukaryota sp. GEM-RC1]
MGVPSLYRWLTDKWPKVAQTTVEELPQVLDKEPQSIDTSLPNPNGLEFDNLYLDMNGIIHPCVRGEEGGVPPSTQEEMFEAIFSYIDRLFNLVRPRKILYMAIDGTAPRAKMNQQRSRRFRSAQEAQDKQEEEEKIAENLQSSTDGSPVSVKPRFDTNQITPGTKFMFDLAEALRFFISHKISTDPGWKYLKVVLSDANVPGEGEHKIMDFIRSQRFIGTKGGYNPNTRHVLYGLDADLIMLGLATHEPYFWILRENVFNQGKPITPTCDLCGQAGHLKEACCFKQIPKNERKDHHLHSGQPVAAPTTSFLLFSVSILREYLFHQFAKVSSILTKIEFDFERFIDDYVFLCFLCGNDFLPHIPSLSIREGGIDILCNLYLSALPNLDSYLTSQGNTEFASVAAVVSKLGLVEPRIFKIRHSIEEKMRKARERRQRQEDLVQPPPEKVKRVEEEPADDDIPEDLIDDDDVSDDEDYDLVANPVNLKTTTVILNKEVFLHETDGRPQYYQVKFDIDITTDEGKKQLEQLCTSYCEGLAWTLKYYFQGCPSWRWFYPYHYAPLAEDLATYMPSCTIDFDSTTRPFLPAEQLLAVFPKASSQWIPKPYRELMLDPQSPLADFFPEQIILDKDGDKPIWRAVVLLPFIDEKLFLESVEGNDYFNRMNEEDRERNLIHPNILFVNAENTLGSFVVATSATEGQFELVPGNQIGSYKSYTEEQMTDDVIKIDPARSHGLVGFLKFFKNGRLLSVLPLLLH